MRLEPSPHVRRVKVNALPKVVGCLSPLRPQVRVSVRTFSMRLEPSPHVRRVKVNALPKVVGFLRVLRFPPTGKVDRVG